MKIKLRCRYQDRNTLSLVSAECGCGKYKAEITRLNGATLAGILQWHPIKGLYVWMWDMEMVETPAATITPLIVKSLQRCDGCKAKAQ